MTARKPKGPKAADGLNGLFDALSDALGDMMARLDEGAAGSFERQHTFETPKGPVRAQAGVRVRMGGHDVTQPRPKQLQPINPDRAAASPAPPPREKEVPCDIIETEDRWTITADVPGIAAEDVTITYEDDTIEIVANGRRRYRARCTLDAPGVMGEKAMTLHNGILTLVIVKEAAI